MLKIRTGFFAESFDCVKVVGLRFLLRNVPLIVARMMVLFRTNYVAKGYFRYYKKATQITRTIDSAHTLGLLKNESQLDCAILISVDVIAEC